MRWRFLAVLVVALVVIGCGKKPVVEAGCVIEGASAPAWVCQSKAPAFQMAASASAASQKDYGRQLSSARQSARNTLVRQTRQAIVHYLKNSEQAATLTQEAIDSASWAGAREAVEESHLHDSWQHPVSQTLYVLVVTPVEPVVQGVAATLNEDEHFRAALSDHLLR
jgi:hypothetical protein